MCEMLLQVFFLSSFNFYLSELYFQLHKTSDIDLCNL